MPASPANETGYWESAEIAAIHDQIFASAGIRWDSPLPFPEPWFATPEAALFRTKLLALLERDFGTAALFIIKDPRIARLLPLWREVLAEFDCQGLVLLTLRNPLEVAASLLDRDRMPLVAGMVLWLRYMLDAEFHSRAWPRAQAGYADLLHDPAAVIGEIDQQLELGLSASIPAADINEFLRPSLRHHKAATRDFKQLAKALPEISTAFELFGKGSLQNIALRSQLDDLRRRLDEAGRFYGSAMADSYGQIRTYAEEIERHKEVLGHRDGEIALLRAEIGRQGAEKAQLQGTIDGLREQSGAQQTFANDLAADIARHKDVLGHRDAEIALLRTEMQHREEQIKILGAELQRGEAAARTLHQELAQRDAALNSLHQKYSALVRESQQLATETDAQRQSLEQEILRLTGEKASFEQQAAEADRFKQQALAVEAALSQQLAALQADQAAKMVEMRAALAQAEIERDSYHQMTELHRRQVIDANVKIAESQAALEALEARMAKHNQNEAAEMAAALDRLRQAESQIIALNEALAAAEIQRLQAAERYMALARNQDDTIIDLHARLGAREQELSNAQREWARVGPGLQALDDALRSLPSRGIADESPAVRAGKILLEQQRQIEAMRGSLSWRLTKGLRAAGRLLRRRQIAQEQELQTSMAIVEASGLFDPAFYLEHNPDVRLSGTNPLRHFVSAGGIEGRQASPAFDTAYYLEQHPYLRVQATNPLIHFILSGRPAPFLRPPVASTENISDHPETLNSETRGEPEETDFPPPVIEPIHVPDAIALPISFMGTLESPPVGASVSNLVLVQGWLIGPIKPGSPIFIHINDIGVSGNSFDRPDVAAAFPKAADAMRSGFTAYIDVSGLPAGTVNLGVSVLSETGERLLCFARPISIVPELAREQASQDATQANREGNATPMLPPPLPSLPKPPLARALVSAASRGWRAWRNGRLPLSPSAWLRAVQLELGNGIPAPGAVTTSLPPYERWMQRNRLTRPLRALMEADAERIAAEGPLISVLVPLYNTPPAYLQQLINCLLAQIYPRWELCLADDASPKPHVARIVRSYMRRDSRIKAVFRESNGHISAATNSALEIATGDFAALLDHDDLLTPDALLHVAECIYAHPKTDWIYTDEDKIDDNGRRFDPQFKAGWSPDMALTHNYTHHLSVFRSNILRQTGGLRSSFNGAQDLDLFLRMAEIVPAGRIRHVPHICYHWRAHPESTATRGDQKSYIFDSAKRGIEEALQRRGLVADAFLPAIAEKHNMCLYQLRWPKDILRLHPVTIVIPTRDRVDLLRKCVASLQKTLPSGLVKLIIVDDKSADPETLSYFDQLIQLQIFSCKVIRNTHPDRGFNYSRLVNLALDHIETEYLLHLNNDIVATELGWLEDMVGWLSVPGVGAVGARLLQPDRTYQHGGIGLHGPTGLPFEYFSRLSADAIGYLALTQTVRNLAAVTGACLLTRKDLYRQLNGYDEAAFGVEFNDVDYCMKVQAAGWRVVFSPQAELIHLGSASRSGIPYNPNEHLNFIEKYRNTPDPYMNPNLLVRDGHISVDPDHFNHAERVSQLKLLLVSHEMQLGGAPIVLAEYARHFKQACGYDVHFASPTNGPLRQRLEEAGIPIHILGTGMHLDALSEGQLQRSLREIGERIGLGNFDLVVANTVTAYWAVEMARLFSKPAVWHIHESLKPQEYETAVGVTRLPLFRRAFAHAHSVVFQSDSTLDLYRSHNMAGNFLKINGGLPVERIETFRASHSRSDLRKKYGIPEDRIVVSLIGVTSERKGQHIFVDAIAKLQKQHGDKLDNVSFLMVGARPDLKPYVDFIRMKMQQSGVRNTEIIDETPDIYDYFGLSDIFVCASYNESFPMVVLLAMAFELRVISTNVFGVAELISDGHEGALIEPGDINGLAKNIMLMIEHEAAYKRLALCARIKVRRLFDNRKLLERHVRLVKEAAMSEPEA